MQPLKTILHVNPRYNTIPQQLKLRIGKTGKGWWTPVWKGLVADSRGSHRTAMGASLWLYLYLLACANRKTGIVRKKHATMSSETGYPLRTIQRHLKRLSSAGYITFVDSGYPPQIRIEKYKLFHHSQSLGNDQYYKSS
jgi:DNA-binding transcriptional ArsR family regulator